MKLKECFIVHNNGSECMLVPTSAAPFAGVVRGNQTLGAILALLKDETTEKAVLEGMKKEFDAPAEVLERDVKKLLGELRKIGALDE